jgi:hypothetical protein
VCSGTALHDTIGLCDICYEIHKENEVLSTKIVRKPMLGPLATWKSSPTTRLSPTAGTPPVLPRRVQAPGANDSNLITEL